MSSIKLQVCLSVTTFRTAVSVEKLPINRLKRMEQIIVIDIEKQLSRNRPFKPLKNETKGFRTVDDRTIVRQIIRV